MAKEFVKKLETTTYTVSTDIAITEDNKGIVGSVTWKPSASSTGTLDIYKLRGIDEELVLQYSSDPVSYAQAYKVGFCASEIVLEVGDSLRIADDTGIEQDVEVVILK